MCSGDAYEYCVIITEETAEKIKSVLQVIADKDKLIKAILKEFKNPHKMPSSERGCEGMKLLNEQQNLLWEIVSLCKKPIAIFHVTSDNCEETWEACSKADYQPMKFSKLIRLTKGKLWITKEDIEKYQNATCVCLPSHHDEDEEFLELLGVITRRLEDYNEHKHTEPIDKIYYMLVDLNTGAIKSSGTLNSIVTEWGEEWYKHDERHYDVREVHVKETNVLDKETLDKTLETIYENAGRI